MNRTVSMLTALFLIVPVLVMLIFSGIVFVKSFDYMDIKKTVDYYTVITNNKNPVNPNEMKYIDEKLDAELAKHRYTSMSFKDAISVLKKIRDTEYHCFNIVLGNGELVYMNNRKFSNAYVIITPDNTYLLAGYRVRDVDIENSIRIEYTMYIMNDSNIYGKDFLYLKEDSRDLLTKMVKHALIGVHDSFFQHKVVIAILIIMFIPGAISAVQEIRKKIYSKKSNNN